MMQVSKSKDNVILYTTTDGNPIPDKTNYASGVNLISNTYENGVGTLTFDGVITTIPNSAGFHGITTLESVEFPDSIVNFGYGLFNGCSGLKSVKLPQYITRIDTYTFYSTGLLTLEIPDGVTYIGTYCFMRSYNFKIFELPASLTSIGRQAFLSTAITDIKILNTTQKVNGAAYMFDNPIIRVPNALLSEYQADSNWNVYRLAGY